MRSRSAWLVSAVVLLAVPRAFAADGDVVGEAFGQPVTVAEFDRFYRTAELFTRTDVAGPRQDAAIREEAWKNLVLSREAERVGVQVDAQQVRDEVRRLVQQRGGNVDAPDYADWARQHLRQDAQAIEQQIRALLRINALIQRKTPPPDVTEDEIRRQFAYEHTAVECEYVRFDDRPKAAAFAARVAAQPALWKPAYDTAKRDNGQRGAGWINLMMLPALRQFWGIPPEDLDRLVALPVGQWTTLTNLYGTVVMRLLDKRQPSASDLDASTQAEYRRRLADAKREHAARAYVAGVFDQAQPREYDSPAAAR